MCSWRQWIAISHGYFGAGEMPSIRKSFCFFTECELNSCEIFVGKRSAGIFEIRGDGVTSHYDRIYVFRCWSQAKVRCV